MGQIIEKIKKYYQNERKIKVFMNGNPESGRTTMIYKWKLNQTIKATPTIGFNIEEIKHNNTTFQFWDCGGGHKIRDIWCHYTQDTDVIITVVDSSYEYNQFYEELLQKTTKRLVEVRGKKIPFLILANKNDRSTHTDEEIIQHVGLMSFIDQVDYHLIRTNCFSGEGLTEALDWLEQKTTK